MIKKKVVAICGSTRQHSINHQLIKAIAGLSAEDFEVNTFDGIGELPQFNPDNDGENVPESVTSFRQLLDNAEGIIICTPEYAHGVPGALKNAIDWTVSSSQFPHKLTMLITASTDGNFGHTALMETLKAIDTKKTDELQMVISFAKTKINTEGKITDEKTLRDLQALLTKFKNALNENAD